MVEGKYDKIKLSSFIDGIIITTDGFHIFKNKEKAELIRSLAKTVGIIVMTDSDVAGFKIRSYIKSLTQNVNVTHIYIPQILGKEKRKTKSSREGTLGVEGIDIAMLIDIFEKQNVEFSTVNDGTKKIEMSDFFDDGFSGKENSSKKKQNLALHLNLPKYMSSKALLSVINIFMTYDEYKEYVRNVSENSSDA